MRAVAGLSTRRSRAPSWSRVDDGPADQPCQEPAQARPTPGSPAAARRRAAGRVAAAAQVLYLVFTEGHTSTTGAGLFDVSLADEAIRLTRQLHRHLPDDGEVSGLLALMLLTDARRAARIDPDGSLVPLAEQDRTLWDRRLSAKASTWSRRRFPRGLSVRSSCRPPSLPCTPRPHAPRTPTGPRSRRSTRMLDASLPSPVVTLNHAVAVPMVDGPTAALDAARPAARGPGDAAQPPAVRRTRAPAREGRTSRGGPGDVRPSGPAGHQHPGAALPQHEGGTT